MGQMNPISTSFNLPDGREVVIETGQLATQAHGSVVVKLGDTMMFASVVSAHEPREGQSFFPLSVDYQERFASIGKIPGNFFRREARLSDYEILVSRLVDRAARPLFPDGYMNDTQIIINLISADKETLPDSLAALAASAALVVSDIPWDGPISEVRVARVNGEFIVNPTRSAMENADMDIIVAATLENVMMVEGESQECDESDLIAAIKIGHDAIKVQCEAQLALAKLVGDKAMIKRENILAEENDAVKEEVFAYAKSKVYDVCKAFSDKLTRKNSFKAVKVEMKAALLEKNGEDWMSENGSFISKYYDKLTKQEIREMVLSESVRLDGRKLDEVRPIWTKVNYLPSAHGSAVFNRGETQSLVSLTLGTKMDQLMVDTALDFKYEKFILHYNFPAYSVGETRPMRGPGRREVGHANLAARALRAVMPSDMPYTIRIVSDILESNGSSSMATVCGGSLAMMDAGLPITKAVSGIAMGMIAEGDRMAILTDILGDEDHIGDMDFKVTGTMDGITACQMDIKIDGLPYEVLEKALEQAKDARIHILNEMAKTIGETNADFKPHAPRMVTLEIDKNFIGAVIGPGGKIIQEIQETSGAVITIEEVDNKGIVNISSSDKASIDKAVARVKAITFTPEVGDVYEAKVASIMPYGVFVDFQGKSGLLHVSEISHTRIENVADVFKEGDLVKIKLIGIDPKSGKFRLSRKALLEKKES